MVGYGTSAGAFQRLRRADPNVTVDRWGAAAMARRLLPQGGVKDGSRARSGRARVRASSWSCWDTRMETIRAHRGHRGRRVSGATDAALSRSRRWHRTLDRTRTRPPTVAYAPAGLPVATGEGRVEG